MNAILQVHDLHVEYVVSGVRLHALHGVAFNVRRAEIVGVLGESGSGKSTLAASLLRGLPGTGTITRGMIALDGTDVSHLNAAELRMIRGKRIAIIPQEPSLALHPTITIWNQVQEVLRAHEPLDPATRRQRALRALSKVFAEEDVERIANSYPHELSGGQRQRALIAQAIACHPLVIVADEPTAALDAATQRDVLKLFAALRKDLDIAFLFITHNPAILLGFADRVMVMYAGRIAEFGLAERVLLAPQHPYTRALLRCFPTRAEESFARSKTQLPLIGGSAPDLAILPTGCVFQPRCDQRIAICESHEPVMEPLEPEHAAACLNLHVGR